MKERNRDKETEREKIYRKIGSDLDQVDKKILTQRMLRYLIYRFSQFNLK